MQLELRKKKSPLLLLYEKIVSTNSSSPPSQGNTLPLTLSLPLMVNMYNPLYVRTRGIFIPAVSNVTPSDVETITLWYSYIFRWNYSVKLGKHNYLNNDIP